MKLFKYKILTQMAHLFQIGVLQLLPFMAGAALSLLSTVVSVNEQEFASNRTCFDFLICLTVDERLAQTEFQRHEWLSQLKSAKGSLQPIIGHMPENSGCLP